MAEEIKEQAFRMECQLFVARLAAQLNNPVVSSGVAITGSIHFAGFLLAQFIFEESKEREMDVQTELNTASGILAVAVSHVLNKYQENAVMNEQVRH